MDNETYYSSNGYQSTALSLYFCGWERCKPGHSFGPAVRSHYLMHLILKGRGQYCVNGCTYSLCANQGFLIFPGESTYYVADIEDPWEYCWIGFDGCEAESLLENCNLTKERLVFTDESNGQFSQNILKLLDIFEQSPGDNYALLGQLYTSFSYLAKSNQITANSPDKLYNEKAVNYIYNNFSYNIKITDIAKFIGIDRTYLYKIFMQHNKLSPQEFLINVRLNAAAHLLTNSNLNITEIAYSCGFKDSSAFYKHFKKHFSTTPVKYRNHIDRSCID